MAGLQDNPPAIYMHGEHLLKDVTTCPGLCNGVYTLARLYDMQHDPVLRDDLTYVSPTTGDRVGLLFITPQTQQDFE
jgi:4-hydroxyphenylacetate 3-monooxygenase